MEMKKMLFATSLYILVSCSSMPPKNDAVIHLNNKEYNFGPIPCKKEAECIFKFTNPGKTPLVISNVETSCGCTAADCTKEPVKPGKSGQIMIKYDAAFPGTFEKTITVHYNGKDSPAILKIKGQVAYPEDVEGPAE